MVSIRKFIPFRINETQLEEVLVKLVGVSSNKSKKINVRFPSAAEQPPGQKQEPLSEQQLYPQPPSPAEIGRLVLFMVHGAPHLQGEPNGCGYHVNAELIEQGV